MKLITRDTDYAVRALRFIAKNDKELTSVSELVKELKIPKPFLIKILQVLSKKGLLKSYKGKGGGFKLSKRPAQILLVDLITACQGSLKVSDHLFKSRLCPDTGKCKLKKKLDNIEKGLLSQLSDITLECLL